MSDNAKCYSVSRDFAEALDDLGARQILIPPRTPRWNGKVERFFRTLDTEWAHGRVWPDSSTRDRALSSFLRFYNRRRPHSAGRWSSTHHARPVGPWALHLDLCGWKAPEACLPNWTACKTNTASATRTSPRSPCPDCACFAEEC